MSIIPIFCQDFEPMLNEHLISDGNRIILISTLICQAIIAEYA